MIRLDHQHIHPSPHYSDHKYQDNATAYLWPSSVPFRFPFVTLSSLLLHTRTQFWHFVSQCFHFIHSSFSVVTGSRTRQKNIVCHIYSLVIHRP